MIPDELSDVGQGEDVWRREATSAKKLATARNPSGENATSAMRLDKARKQGGET